MKKTKRLPKGSKLLIPSHPKKRKLAQKKKRQGYPWELLTEKF